MLDAGLFLRAGLGCIAVLALLGTLAAYLASGRAAEEPSLALRAFLLDEEQNLPTFFAFGLLICCSLLLGLIGAQAFLLRQRFRFHWALLAAVFFLIAFDEAAMLHEKLNGPLRAALGASVWSGWAYFPWVIPAGSLVALLALLYLPFLRSLAAPYGRLFVAAGALYVGGALGLEMLGAAHYEAHGGPTFGYHLVTTAEETLEMLGLAVFAYALMRFLAGRGGVCLGFRAG
jgi:hypothetical protein